MICDRCFQPLDQGAHGLYVCPLEARVFAPVIRPDDIPGGVLIEHGLCNEDGSPKRYYSRSEIKLACAVKGFVPWTDVYEERHTKDAHVHNDWLKSGEAQKARAERVEMRREKAARR